MQVLKYLINAIAFEKNNNTFPLTGEIFNQVTFLNFKSNLTLALVTLIISTFSHSVLSLINKLYWRHS